MAECQHIPTMHNSETPEIKSSRCWRKHVCLMLHDRKHWPLTGPSALRERSHERESRMRKDTADQPSGQTAWQRTPVTLQYCIKNYTRVNRTQPHPTETLFAGKKTEVKLQVTHALLNWSQTTPTERFTNNDWHSMFCDTNNREIIIN